MFKSWKGPERWLFAAGALLCLFAAGAVAYRSAYSRLAVRSFRAVNEAGEATAPVPTEVALPANTTDFRLWAAKRIALYRDSLASHTGKPVAILRAPRLDIEAPVFEGTDELTLDRGVGRIAGTARPGGAGNLGIAGHRDGFFRALKDAAAGDVVILETPAGVDEYMISGIQIVAKSDVTVLAATETPALTLVTCYPFYFVGDAPRRYIVRCELKERRDRKALRPAEALR